MSSFPVRRNCTRKTNRETSILTFITIIPKERNNFVLSEFIPIVLCEGMSVCAQHPYGFFKTKGKPKLQQVSIDSRFESQVSAPALNTTQNFPSLFIFLHIVFEDNYKILFTFKISSSLK